MAIEGPLRELGIHDVFQLLDLSRKTGVLRVTSELRDNEGRVYFDNGKVLFATIRSNPSPIGVLLVRAGKLTEADVDKARNEQERHAAEGRRRRIGELLVESGAITQKELDRQVRIQIEAVVFELMSWREGFFSFEEGGLGDVPADATMRLSTESLLMEGARRIDEWSRIADKVPHLGVIPVLAQVDDDHPTLLDLLPNEWEVLSVIDGTRDLRAIAQLLARSEFDIAKIAYGLVSTGVVDLRTPERVSVTAALPFEDALPFVDRANASLEAGDFEQALVHARAGIAADPQSADARLAAARALSRLGRHSDSAEELRRAAQADPLNPHVQLELGFAAARRGEFEVALGAWEHYLRAIPQAPQAERVRGALDAVKSLAQIGRAHV